VLDGTPAAYEPKDSHKNTAGHKEVSGALEGVSTLEDSVIVACLHQRVDTDAQYAQAQYPEEEIEGKHGVLDELNLTTHCAATFPADG